jgi:hypothetical protein
VGQGEGEVKLVLAVGLPAAEPESASRLAS